MSSQTKNQTKSQQAGINREIALTKRDFITELCVPPECRGCWQVFSVIPGYFFVAKPLFQSSQFTRIDWLLTEQKKRSKSQLMTKNSVKFVNWFRHLRLTRFHKNRSQKRHENVNCQQAIDQRKIMLTEPAAYDLAEGFFVAFLGRSLLTAVRITRLGGGHEADQLSIT